MKFTVKQYNSDVFTIIQCISLTFGKQLNPLNPLIRHRH